MIQGVGDVPKHVLLEFQNLNIEQLQFLYDFLEADLDTLSRVLSRISSSEQVDTLIEEVKNFVQQDDLQKMMQYGDLKLLKNFLKKRITIQILHTYLQGLDVEQVKQQLQQEEVQERPIVHQNSILLNQARIILDQIMDFLDPHSLHVTRLVCLKLNEYFQDPIRSDKFYQKFCKALFAEKNFVQYISSPFEAVRSYINSNLNIYAQQLQLINSINNNPSEAIWNNWGNIIETKLTYNDIKKNFKCHKDMFEQYLRLNYCGVYAMKEYYVKYGEVQFRQTSAPCLRVEFFRYLRFWRDGTFTMFISTKKLSKQKLLEYFKYPEYQSVNKKEVKQQLEDSFLRGEYRIVKDEVYAISARQSTTFMYVYKIKTYNNKHPGNVLMVQSGQMHTLGDNYRQDIIDPQKRSHYIYKHFEEFRIDFQENEGAWKNIVF